MGSEMCIRDSEEAELAVVAAELDGGGERGGRHQDGGRTDDGGLRGAKNGGRRQRFAMVVLSGRCRAFERGAALVRRGEGRATRRRRVVRVDLGHVRLGPHGTERRASASSSNAGRASPESSFAR